MKLAVLGLLTERRGYGYDIANRLRHRLGPGFTASTNAVYVSLDQLVKEGLATATERARTRRQVRVWYEATPRGLDRVEAWMREAPSREPLRGELYLKLAVARPDHLPLLRAELERLERACVSELQERAGAIALAPAGGPRVTWDVAARWLADAAALERLGGDLRWIRMALRMLAHAAADGSLPAEALRGAASASGR